MGKTASNQVVFLPFRAKHNFSTCWAQVKFSLSFGELVSFFSFQIMARWLLLCFLIHGARSHRIDMELHARLSAGQAVGSLVVETIASATANDVAGDSSHASRHTTETTTTTNWCDEVMRNL